MIVDDHCPDTTTGIPMHNKFIGIIVLSTITITSIPTQANAGLGLWAIGTGATLAKTLHLAHERKLKERQKGRKFTPKRLEKGLTIFTSASIAMLVSLIHKDRCNGKNPWFIEAEDSLEKSKAYATDAIVAGGVLFLLGYMNEKKYSTKAAAGLEITRNILDNLTGIGCAASMIEGINYLADDE